MVIKVQWMIKCQCSKQKLRQVNCHVTSLDKLIIFKTGMKNETGMKKCKHEKQMEEIEMRLINI